jgi:HD-GYP domain-containing protein (c-di-GMP phosphodiesterase class II)
MALVPILLAMYVFLDGGRDPRVLLGRSGAIFVLMIASAVAGFYFIKAELSRTFLMILDRANRHASDDLSRHLREASDDEIGRIGETIQRITASLEDRSAEAELAKDRMRRGIGKVSHALQTARDEEGLLQLLVEGVVESVDARTAYLVGVDEETGDFVTRAAAGEAAEEVRTRRIPLGEGVPGLAARERRPIILPDRDAVDSTNGAEGAGLSPGTIMAAPLLQGESLHGVLIVEDRRDGGKFDEEELGILSNLTTLAAVALGQWGAQSRLRQDLDDVLAVFARVIEERDPYARGRSERVSRYCEAMARSLRLDEDTVTMVRRAALLHGIGKVTLPDSLLRSETKLTEEELEHVRSYAATGERLLADVPALAAVCPMVRHHNERCDGSGYPDGLKAEEIPLTTHLVIVAHAFDAMTSDRSFRRAITVRDAIDRMQQGAGKLFDRRAVQALVGLGPRVLKATDDREADGATVRGKGTASISVRD